MPEKQDEKIIETKGANRVRIGFLAAFVLLLISNALSYISTLKVNEQSRWVNHTTQIIHDLDNLLAFVTRAENSYRGYLIDKEKTQLETFAGSVQNMDSVVSLIRKSTIDNPSQQVRINRLDTTLQSAIVALQDRIRQFRSNTTLTDDIIAENAKANVLLLGIEDQVHKMQDEERHIWSMRSSSISEYSALIKILSLISIIIAILLTLYSIMVFNKENKARKESDHKAAELRRQLEGRVNQLAELNTELIELRNLEKYAVTGRIARTIAHEVRNPLTNINLAIEQLRSDFDKIEGTDMFFDMINRNSERINKLVSDLLNSTRLTELNKKDVIINDVLDECLEEAKDRLVLKHIRVEKNYDTEICAIPMDVDRIKIAFLNLIVNAIEAMEDRGTLSIVTHTEKNQCIITISDTGRGMSKEQMGRLFEPFFTTKPKGNGLGLANAQNIIISHNGRIKARSEEGVGTTFTIIFEFS